MAPNPFRKGSIALRLVMGALVWLGLALAVTFVILTQLFESTVAQNFDAVLLDHADEVLSMAEVRADGTVAMKRHPADPRFLAPGSGWYWVFLTGHGRREQSRSFGTASAAVIIKPTAEGAIIAPYRARDPFDQGVRVIGKQVSLAPGDHRVTVLVAGPAAVIAGAVSEFNGTLLISLTVLGTGLILAVIFQVHYGLRPLRRIRRMLTEIRTGCRPRLDGDFPDELEPLAHELNALLDHNERSVERTRARMGDLAHALKTPIAVLKNAGEQVDGEAGEEIRKQVAVMSDSVNHHLARARAAGTGGVIGARTPVGPVVDDLQHALERIFVDDGLAFEVDLAGDLAFRGERQDLEEMLGNLMENACKWAKRKISVRGVANGNSLLIEVADDGPGIAEEDRIRVLARGLRLDETTPGTGLGLPIVRDIAKLYGGVLDLADSAHGGVAARLKLPTV